MSLRSNTGASMNELNEFQCRHTSQLSSLVAVSLGLNACTPIHFMIYVLLKESSSNHIYLVSWLYWYTPIFRHSVNHKKRKSVKWLTNNRNIYWKPLSILQSIKTKSCKNVECLNNYRFTSSVCCCTSKYNAKKTLVHMRLGFTYSDFTFIHHLIHLYNTYCPR